MSRITRHPKTAGTVQFQTEVAAGAIDILDTEVDNDFDDIYRLVNGNLDDDNISGSPKKILGSKLNLSGTITVGDLAPGFVLPGGQIGPNTIPRSALVPGATTANLLVAGDDTSFQLNANVETLLAEVSWTTAGGFWIAQASFIGWISGTGALTVTYRLRVGSSANGVLDGTPAQSATQQISLGSGATDPLSVSLLSAGNFLEPHTDPRRVQLTVASSSAFCHKESARLIVNESR